MPLEGNTNHIEITQETINPRAQKIIDFLTEKREQVESQTGLKYDLLEQLNNHLLETLTGKWRMGDPSIKRIDRQRSITHARSFDEAVRGEFASTTNYFGWSERYFCREDMKKIPETPDAAIHQLRIFDWWIGNGQGDPKPVIQQLLAVQETHRVDFINQLETSFMLAGDERRQAMIHRLQKTGDKIDGMTLEELDIQLERMYTPKTSLQSITTPLASLRVTGTLGGQSFLTLSQDGLPPQEFELTGQKTPLAALPKIIGNVADLAQQAMR